MSRAISFCHRRRPCFSCVSHSPPLRRLFIEPGSAPAGGRQQSAAGRAVTVTACHLFLVLTTFHPCSSLLPKQTGKWRALLLPVVVALRNPPLLTQPLLFAHLSGAHMCHYISPACSGFDAVPLFLSRNLSDFVVTQMLASHFHCRKVLGAEAAVCFLLPD